MIDSGRRFFSLSSFCSVYQMFNDVSRKEWRKRKIFFFFFSIEYDRIERLLLFVFLVKYIIRIWKRYDQCTRHSFSIENEIDCDIFAFIRFQSLLMKEDFSFFFVKGEEYLFRISREESEQERERERETILMIREFLSSLFVEKENMSIQHMHVHTHIETLAQMKCIWEIDYSFSLKINDNLVQLEQRSSRLYLFILTTLKTSFSSSPFDLRVKIR